MPYAMTDKYVHAFGEFIAFSLTVVSVTDLVFVSTKIYHRFASRFTFYLSDEHLCTISCCIFAHSSVSATILAFGAAALPVAVGPAQPVSSLSGFNGCKAFCCVCIRVMCLYYLLAHEAPSTPRECAFLESTCTVLYPVPSRVGQRIGQVDMSFVCLNAHVADASSGFA